MFPEIEIIKEQEQAFSFNGRAFLYDYEKGDFVYKNGSPVIVEGKAAILAWIEKVIRTEKFRFNIYKEIEYGVTIDDLIGGKFPRYFMESEIEREITEALLKNDYILNIGEWVFEYSGSNLLTTFSVTIDNETFNYKAVI